MPPLSYWPHFQIAQLQAESYTLDGGGETYTGMSEKLQVVAVRESGKEGGDAGQKGRRQVVRGLSSCGQRVSFILQK